MKTFIGVILAGLMILMGGLMALCVVGALMLLTWMMVPYNSAFASLFWLFNPVTLGVGTLAGLVGGFFWSRGLLKP